MTGLDIDPLYGIRLSRADPPGLARNGRRRAVYGAALTQFEELMRAAEAASAQTRPLTLFYALSQAGRAVAAAHLEGDWLLEGHGLKAINIGAADIADVSVRPDPREVDSFSGIASATESESLKGRVGLIELWASLPNLCWLIPEDERRIHPVPLGVTLLGDPMSNLRDWRWVLAGVAPLTARDAAEAEAVLRAYRQARTAELRTVQGLRPIRALTEHGEGVEVCWPNPSQDYPGETAVLEQVAPFDPHADARWLRPELTDGSSPSDLVAFWALLYALSMLARYQPATWSQILDYDRSAWAAPLSELLRLGVEMVPPMVHGALYRP